MRQKGFTLIELMIVVAIIGILGAIAIPNVLAFQCRTRGRDAGFHPRLVHFMCSGKYSHCQEDDKKVCMNALKNGEARLEDFFGPDVVDELRNQYGLDKGNLVVEESVKPDSSCANKVEELEKEIQVLRSLIAGDVNSMGGNDKKESHNENWKE